MLIKWMACVGVSGVIAAQAPGQWSQTQALELMDQPGSRFGEVLDREGDRLIVGATQDATIVRFTGSASVYRQEPDGQWVLEQVLFASDAQRGDGFAPAAIWGDRAAVFTVFRSPFSSGHFFERQPDGQWIETQKIDTDPYDLAGVWVDMNLSWGVAGTLGTRDAGETDGNVLTYRLVDDEWVPGPIVRPPVPTQDTFFAATAVLDGDFLYVGAPNDNENGELAGAVYVFREDAGEWVFEQKILGPRANALFGATLDVDGDVLAGGAICSGCFFDTSLAYSAFAFERVDGRWEFAGELQPQGGSTPFMRFGTGITVDGDRIVVGARFAGDGAGGAAFEFRRTDQWRPRSVIVSPVQDRGQDFGIGMSVDGDELLVGAPQISGGIGLPGARVFAFEFCTADFDNDGELTIFDFLEFQTRFADMDLAADLDGDGVLTIFDFLAFQTAFDDGCP